MHIMVVYVAISALKGYYPSVTSEWSLFWDNLRYALSV